MKTYLERLSHILNNGEEKPDRTGTGTISVFGTQDRYNLANGFPAVTTKKLAWRQVVSELLWFLEGSGDERRLCEILHNTRDASKRTIWTDNANADYWKANATYEGDLGRVYGVQWRTWQKADGTTVDQLTELIKGLKTDPHGRRHIISAWNPGEIKSMALPPCHCFAQFYVSADNKLSCQMYQRSADLFLGVPFNIASYSLLTHMIAQVCGMEVGEFIHTLGDAHIYSNHVDQVKEQLSRTPLTGPILWLDPSIKNITDFKMDHIRLVGYESLAPIIAPMAT